MRAPGRSWQRRLAVIAGLAACLVAVPAAEAKYGFKVSPGVGGPKAAFKVSFVAPAAVSGRETDYFLEGIGPARCPMLFEFAGRTRRDARVVMRLTPGDDLSPFENVPNRSRWCRGTYVGIVYLSARDDDPDLLIGRFRFRVTGGR